MNAVTNEAVAVDVVSDVVCPWCFIGKRRLDAALARFGAHTRTRAVQVRWHPFFLNPDTPPEGEPYRPFLERKFGGASAVTAMWSRLRSVGAGDGIDFAFDRIELRANTLAAHRLIHRFQSTGRDAGPLVERLFVAGFCDGRFVGSPAELADIAAACGEAKDETEAWLNSDADADTVRVQAERFRRLGVNGVPFFIFNGRLAVEGAQPQDVLLDALRQSLG